MIRKCVYAFILIILFPTISHAFDLYVHSAKAPLFQAPSIGSKKIIELKKGAKLIGIEERANWYRVEYDNKNAWVYKLMVRKAPPLDRKAVSDKQVEELAYKARRRPSSFATTAAARGLREKRKRFSDKYALDYYALEKMESIKISDDEALEFLMRGVSNEEKN